jgi:hypothetical protein
VLKYVGRSFLLLLSIVVLSACSGTGSSGGDAKLQVPEHGRSEIRSEYRAWNKDDLALTIQEERLMQECMSKSGWKYRPDIEGPISLKGKNFVDSDFIIDSETVRKLGGYKKEESNGEGGGDVVNPGRRNLGAKDAEQWDVAAYGTEDTWVAIPVLVSPGNSDSGAEQHLGGCRLQSLKELYGTPEKYVASQFVDSNLASFAFGEAYESPEMKTLEDEFSACMSDAGFSHDSEGGSIKSPENAQGLAQDKPADQYAIALADAGCQQNKEYAKRRIELEDRYLTAVADYYEPQIQGALEIKRQALAMGKRLLG